MRRVFSTGQSMRVANRQDKRAWVPYRPVLASLARWEKMHEVTETGHDILLDRCRVWQKEGHGRLAGLDVFDALRRHSQAHRSALVRAGRLNQNSAPEQFRQENGVPGAPSREAPASIVTRCGPEYAEASDRPQ